MNSEFNIILASASPRRKELLERYISEFEIIPTDIDETINLNNIKTLDCCKAEIENISYKKALAVKTNIKPNSLIIGADTVVYLNGKVYGKPSDINEAEIFLKSLSGKTHQVITAVTIINSEKEIVTQLSDVTDVKFINQNDELIKWYLSDNEYKDKAGAYAIQGLGSIFIEYINGDYDNVVGLPISKIMRNLYEKSINLLSRI